MTETIEYEQFDQADANGGSAAEVDLSRLSDIPMELSVEIGRTHMTVGQTLDLRTGSVVTLERLAGEAADLLVNGTPIARGEVVVAEEQYGLRITEILEAQPEHETLPAGSAAAAGAGEPAAQSAGPQDGEAAIVQPGGADGSAAGEA